MSFKRIRNLESYCSVRRGAAITNWNSRSHWSFIKGNFLIVNHFSQAGNASRRPGQGHKHSTTSNEDWYLALTAMRNQKMKANLLTQPLRSVICTTATTQIIWYQFHAADIYACWPVSIVTLIPRHRGANGCDHLNMWTGVEMNGVIMVFLFSVHPDNRRIFICKERNTRNIPTFVQGRIKFSRWESGLAVIFSLFGALISMLVKGKFWLIPYRNEIIKPIVFKYAVAIGDDFMLVKDNCRTHYAQLVDGSLFKEKIIRMECPACLLYMISNRRCLEHSTHTRSRPPTTYTNFVRTEKNSSGWVEQNIPSPH